MNRKVIMGSVAAAGILLMSFTAPVTEGTENESGKSGLMSYTINKSNATVKWEGSKITGSGHYGTIDLKESMLQMDGDKLVGGSFKVNMSTIKSTDLSGNMAAKLEGHLKSDDFFGVENYPEASFIITKVKPGSEKNEFHVKGDLTIKKTTKQVDFPVTISWNDGQAVASATITIDRADFDVRYGSDRFFDNLGDKAINNEFTLNVDLRPMSGM